jgi:hypothetical protein
MLTNRNGNYYEESRTTLLNISFLPYTQYDYKLARSCKR